MLTISRIKVEGWCQHDNLSLDFHKGANGLIGPNGIGKSNAVCAILTALTGRVATGKIEDNIKHNTDQAKLVLDFNVDGTSGTITRAFTAPVVSGVRGDCTSSASLSFGNGVKGIRVKGVSAVNAKIIEITGISLKVLTEHVFIAQDELSKLLFSTRGDRLASLMLLIPALADAEAKRLLLHKELVAFPEVVFVDNSKELEASKTKVVTTIASAEKALSEMAVKLQHINRDELQQQLPVVEKAGVRHNELLSAQAVVKSETASKQGIIDALLAQRSELEKKLSVEPMRPYVMPSLYAETVLAKETAQSRAVGQRALLLALREGKCCPTCEGQIDSKVLQTDVIEARGRDLAAIAGKLESITERCLAEQRRHDSACAAEQALRGEYTHQLRTCTESHKAATAELEVLRQRLGTCHRELAVYSQSPAEEATRIRALLQACQVVELEMARLETTLTLSKGTKELIETQLASTDAARAKAQNTARYRKLLEGVRAILHKENLQKDLLTHYLSTLCAKVNEYLKIFSSPFSIEISPELDITAAFPSGYSPDILRLSGGQRCFLSVAFRFAISDIFAKQSGLIVLDEPTAYLDDDNLLAVGTLISQVHTYCEKAGMQVVIITHDREILPGFSNVIDLAREVVRN